jgi:hypothetical protein
MANTLRIKRRAGGGSAGAPASLANAELAYNESDPNNGILYYGLGTGGAGGTATSVIPIGGPGWAASLASPTFTGTPAAPTAAANTNTTQIATTAFVLGQGNSTAGTITMNGTQAAGSSNLYARADHVHPTDTSRAPLASPTFTGTPAAPTAAADTNTTQLATTAFVLGQASSTTPAALSTAAVGTSNRYARADHVHAMPTFSQIGTATADVSIGGFKLTSLADPVSAQDAATKAYVDASRSGLDVKQSVRAATTANITLSGTQTIDGVALIAGDRVLVKDQSTGSANGIYVVAASSWSRSTDADTDAEVHAGMFTFVEEGTTHADSGWVLSTNNPIVVGSTSLTFAQFSGAGQITAGDGLTKTGNTINAVGTSNRISVAADSIDIASTYVGQTSITTLGTITTGVWNGTTVAVANGGTGATTLTGVLKGNGTSAFTAAVDGTDYLSPNATIDGGTF